MAENGEKSKSVAEMHPPKEKPKYEFPTVVSLGELGKGTGACTAGSLDAEACTAGAIAEVACTAGGLYAPP